jgi:uncharacterized protein (DUF2062 family)
LLSAFLVPIGQFICAALLAIPTRANVPVAAAATLVTNPITFPPIYYAAYRLGFFLGVDAISYTPIRLLATVAAGMLCIGVVLAATAFLGSRFYFRVRLSRRWTSRKEGTSRPLAD